MWCKEGVSNLQLWTQILNVALTEKYEQKIFVWFFKDLSDFILKTENSKLTEEILHFTRGWGSRCLT